VPLNATTYRRIRVNIGNGHYRHAHHPGRKTQGRDGFFQVDFFACQCVVNRLDLGRPSAICLSYPEYYQSSGYCNCRPMHPGEHSSIWIAEMAHGPFKHNMRVIPLLVISFLAIDDSLPFSIRKSQNHLLQKRE
jgi:hypothetical protein